MAPEEIFRTSGRPFGDSYVKQHPIITRTAPTVPVIKSLSSRDVNMPTLCFTFSWCLLHACVSVYRFY